jgi:hypothetical protein
MVSIGRLLSVRITGATATSLVGEIDSASFDRNSQSEGDLA